MKEESKGKRILMCVLGVVLYLVFVYGIECLGYISAFGWIAAIPLSAFLAAGPIMLVETRIRKPGAYILFGVLWLVLSFTTGMVWNASGPVIIIVLTAAAEIIRRALGYEKKKAYILSYLPASLFILGQYIYVWTSTDRYIEEAIAEMGGEAYGIALRGYATAGGLILVILASLALGCVGAVLSAKVLKIEANSNEVLR
mgnify:FL=1